MSLKNTLKNGSQLLTQACPGFFFHKLETTKKIAHFSQLLKFPENEVDLLPLRNPKE